MITGRSACELATYKIFSSGDSAMPFGRSMSFVSSVSLPSGPIRYTPWNDNSLLGSSIPFTNPYGGSVK